MASFHVYGNAELTQAFSSLAQMPSSVVVEMAKAMGDVVASSERKTAASMLQGPYYAGGVAGGVNVESPKKTGKGASVLINFKGSQHGNRIGEIAYINEYGKKSQPARTFIQSANKSSESEAVQAAEDVLDKFLASKGF